MNTIKIGVLSDSHKKTNLTQDAINHLKTKNIQYIIHAGDLEIVENLQILKNSNLPFVCVYGNNDFNLVEFGNDFGIKKEPYYFKIKDVKFKLMHLPFYLTGDTDIVISGHTHMFEQSFINKTLFLNPGEVCARNKDLTECAYLEISDDKYTLEYNFKKPEDNSWQTECFSYEREN
jgi:putative phosphoesterase